MRKIAGLLLVITLTFACGTGPTPAPAPTTPAQPATAADPLSVELTSYRDGEVEQSQVESTRGGGEDLRRRLLAAALQLGEVLHGDAGPTSHLGLGLATATSLGAQLVPDQGPPELLAGRPGGMRGGVGEAKAVGSSTSRVAGTAGTNARRATPERDDVTHAPKLGGRSG